MRQVMYKGLINVPVGLVKTIGSLTFFLFPAILVLLGKKDLSAVLLVLYGSVTVCASIGVGWLEQSYMRFQDRSELLKHLVFIILSAILSIIIFVTINRIYIGLLGYFAVVLYITGEFQQRILAVDFLIRGKKYEHNLLITTRCVIESVILIFCLIPGFEPITYLTIFLTAFSISRIFSFRYLLNMISCRKLITWPGVEYLFKSNMVSYGIWITLMVSTIQLFINYMQNTFVANSSGSISSLISFSRYSFLAVSLPYGILLVAFTPQIFRQVKDTCGFDLDLEILNKKYLTQPIPIVLLVIVGLFVVNHLYFKLLNEDVFLLVFASISWSLALMSIKPAEIAERSIDLFIISLLSCIITYYMYKYLIKSEYLGLLFSLTNCYVIFYFLQAAYQILVKYTRIAFINLLISSFILIVTCLGFLTYRR